MKEERKYVLAIDQGTSGPKIGIIDQEGHLLKHISEKVETHYLPDNGAEQDPHEWWTTIIKAAKKIIEETGVAKDIVGICCTAQFSSTVAVDEHGEPLMNALTWLDQRGAPYTRAAVRGFPSVKGYGLFKLLKWLRITGYAPILSGIDGIGHTLFIKNKFPEIYRGTYKFLEPIDYLNFRLTGKCVATQNTALPFLLVDNRRWDSRKYDEGLLKIVGISREKLADLVPINHVIGPLLPSVAGDLGLPHPVPVVEGVNDNTSGVIGSGAVGDYDGVISIGTTSSLSIHQCSVKSDLDNGLFTIPSPVKEHYVLSGETGLGGKSLDFIMNNIVFPEDEFNREKTTEEHPAVIADRVASRIPAGSDGILFLPWLNGAIAPVADSSMRGGFLNLNLETTRGHLVRSVYEGVALNFKWVLQAAQKHTGRKFEYLKLAGGGALSDTWAQIMADVLQTEIHQLENPRGVNISGAAFIALEQLGKISYEDIPGMVKVRKVFRPDQQNFAVYEKHYGMLKKVFRCTRPLFRSLNR